MKLFLLKHVYLLYTPLLLLFLNSCLGGKVYSGKSETITESKRRNVFINELKLDPMLVIVDDSNSWQVETAFVEKYWKSNSRNQNETYYEPFEGRFQIVIRFAGMIALEGQYNVDWVIVSDHEDRTQKIYCTTINYPLCAFVAYLDNIPTDTLTFNYRRYSGFLDGKKQILMERELFSLYPM